MMLFQHMMFAVWWVPFAAYLANINVTGIQNALMLSSMAIGCMFSPLVGMLADRYYRGEKILSLLNFLNALFLFLAGLTSNHVFMFVELLLAMVCYMPTWALTSSIAMTHAPSDIFPRIRVFGSIGWVASGLFSVIMVKAFGIKFDGTNTPFFLGAAVSFIAGISNLNLPATPPLAKGEKSSFIDAFGLRTLKLMSKRNFSVFIILSFLSVIPFAMYWSYCSEFLQDQGFEFISITMNWGQLAEMLILVTLPFSIKKVGLRNTMAIGLIALLIRYFSFYTGIWSGLNAGYYIGILVHGFIFGYFYVGGQIYIDKEAPPGVKSQAQGFIFLVTFGLGLLVGNFVSRQVIEIYSWGEAGIEGYNWIEIWRMTTLMSLIILLSYLYFFKDKRNGDHIGLEAKK